MKNTGLSRSAKVKLSGAVLGWTVEVLERFRKEAGLPTRSTALCEALAQWARDYAGESTLEKVLAKYGKPYQESWAREERRASRFLPLLKRTQGP